MPLAVPCIDCGNLAQPGPRCDTCQERADQIKAARRERKRAPEPTSTARGYDNKWRRLSERARRLQPFCSDCGATENLTCDHSPEAWERKARGLEIRLQDVDVVCDPCNQKRGAARGQRARRRSKASKTA